MHKIELTKLERDGLNGHHLIVDAPSQLSDAFRLGMKWAQDNEPQSDWISVETPEDINFDGEVLCWDGCDYSIDYVDIDVDTGVCFMANGTEVESYKLLTPPSEDNETNI